MISSESPVLENSTPGLTSGGEETWLRPRLRHRHRAKAAGNSYSLVPTAGRASPRLYKLIRAMDTKRNRPRWLAGGRESTFGPPETSLRGRLNPGFLRPAVAR